MKMLHRTKLLNNYKLNLKIWKYIIIQIYIIKENISKNISWSS